MRASSLLVEFTLFNVFFIKRKTDFIDVYVYNVNILLGHFNAHLNMRTGFCCITVLAEVTPSCNVCCFRFTCRIISLSYVF